VESHRETLILKIGFIMMNTARFLRKIRMKHFKIGLGTLVLIGILISVLQAPASPIQAASLAQPPLEPQYPVQEAALREAFSLSIQGRTDVWPM
jgi:hypothetical protein